MDADAITDIRSAEGKVYRTRSGRFYYVYHICLVDEGTTNPLRVSPGCTLVNLSDNKHDFPTDERKPLDALYDLEKRVDLCDLPERSRAILEAFKRNVNRPPNEEVINSLRSAEGKLH